MVVKTTAIYIPLRTVLEKQYFVIRVEETKRLRVKETKSQKALALALALAKRLRVKKSKSVGVSVRSLLIAHYYTPPQ